MAFATTPFVGGSLTDLQNSQQGKQVAIGTTVFGSNGRRYLRMVAGAEIASASGNGTQLAAPTTTLIAATGSGGWYSVPNVVVPNGAAFWAREGVA